MKTMHWVLAHPIFVMSIVQAPLAMAAASIASISTNPVDCSITSNPVPVVALTCDTGDVDENKRAIRSYFYLKKGVKNDVNGCTMKLSPFTGTDVALEQFVFPSQTVILPSSTASPAPLPTPIGSTGALSLDGGQVYFGQRTLGTVSSHRGYLFFDYKPETDESTATATEYIVPLPTTPTTVSSVKQYPCRVQAISTCSMLSKIEPFLSKKILLHSYLGKFKRTQDKSVLKITSVSNNVRDSVERIHSNAVFSFVGKDSAGHALLDTLGKPVIASGQIHSDGSFRFNGALQNCGVATLNVDLTGKANLTISKTEGSSTFACPMPDALIGSWSSPASAARTASAAPWKTLLNNLNSEKTIRACGVN